MHIACVEPAAVTIEDIGDDTPSGIEMDWEQSSFRVNHGGLQAPLAVASYVRQTLGDNADISVANLKYTPSPEFLTLGTWDYEGREYPVSLYGNIRREAGLVENDVVLVSSTYAQGFEAVKDLAGYLKDQTKGRIRVVVGGSDASNRPEDYDFADVVVVGEVERLTPEQLTEIIRGEIECKIVHGVKPFPQMDEVPIAAYDLIDPKECAHSHDGNPITPPVISTYLSRGCPFKCKFCTVTGTKGPKLRFSFKRVEQDLDAIKKHGFNTVSWDEDNFLLLLNLKGGRDMVFAILQMMNERGLKWEWPNGLQTKQMWNNTSNAPDLKLIEALYGPNCAGGMVPAETVVPAEMKEYKKLLDFERQMEVSRVIGSMGRRMRFTIIVGRPEESPETLALTEENARKVQEALSSKEGGFARAYILNATPLPGSDDFREQAHRIVYPLRTHSLFYTYMQSVYQGNHFSPIQNVENRFRLDRALNGETESTYRRSLVGKGF